MHRCHKWGPWRAAALLFILLTGVLSAPVSSSGPRLITFPYRDDFDYSSNWSVVEGAWRYAGGILNGSGFDARIVAGDASWRDYNVSGRFMMVAGGEAALMFRVVEARYGENNGQYMQVSNSLAGGVTLYRIYDGRVSRGSAAFAFSAGTWYDFRISVEGNRIDYYVNGTWVLNYTQLEFSAGKIGLKAYASTCHFDGIEVRDHASNATLFSDSFGSSPFGGWDPMKGTWYFSGGECDLISDGSGDDLMLAPVVAPGDRWTARVQLMWTAGSSFETGLCFGFDNMTSSYLAYLSASDQTIRMSRRNGTGINDRWAQAAFPVKKGEWNTLTVVKDGGNLTLFVNTARILTKNDPSPLPGDGFAFASRSASQERARINFFEVQEGANPPRPDLLVNLSALELYPPHPNPGEDVLFKFNIDNTGTADAAGNFSVRLSHNGTVLAAAYPENVLAAGQSGLVFIHWKANISGNLSLTLTVDAEDQLAESNESNNNATVRLEVNAPPLAAIAVAPQDGSAEVDQELVFDGNGSRDPDGKISSFLWNFGDRTAASVPVARHKYTEAGTYTVTLNVTDNDGACNVASRKVLVRERIPAVNITWSPVRGNVSTPFNFRYQLHDPDRTFSGFRWDFGDGNNTTDQAPAHKYADDRTYNVTFTIFYNMGRNATYVSRQLTVENTPPEVRILTAPAELQKNQPGYFRACATDPDDLVRPLSLVWSFPDGASISGEEATRSFNRSGVFRVTLTVTDEEGVNATAFTLVRVSNAAPDASFALPPPAYANSTFVFDAGFSRDPDGQIVNYSWDFGDGQTGRGIVGSHNYSIPGNYTVTLTVTDDEGARDSFSGTLWVRQTPTVPIRPEPRPKEPSPLVPVLMAVAVVVLLIALLAWWKLRKGGPAEGKS